MFSHSLSLFISGELSTEAINHDTEETLSGCATRRGKYFVHTLNIINAIGLHFHKHYYYLSKCFVLWYLCKTAS